MKSFFAGFFGGLLALIITIVFVVVGGFVLMKLDFFEKTDLGNTLVNNSNVIINPTSAEKVYENNIDGVVTVINLQKVNLDSFFFFYLPNSDEDSLVESGVGSGFIYKEEKGYYYAITNNHVISGSDELKIQTSYSENEQEVLKAEIVGADSENDLAVIRFKSPDELTVLEMGDSSTVKAGQDVFAIGSPFGTELQGSITKGIVSAPARKISDSNTAINYIQTDAAINPGNSGGPLFDATSSVVGINTLKITDSQSDNIGFSIPINTALEIVKKIELGGTY